MARILVLYHSQQYGNTEKMALAIADGAKATGASVDLFNANQARFNIEAYRSYDAAALGTPDYYGYLAGTMKVFLDDWYIAKRDNPTGLLDKPIALFYSHGGGGAVKHHLEQLFKRLGPRVGETIESSGAPSDRILAACRELGRQLAKEIGNNQDKD